ncbi:translation initiation factor [Schlesneria paludicola]|uniref:translation initiation factor n=1 Tax=Schlesneria paludicola TaxID=360056 RepID=UPI00029A9830|nr:translation initiation factor [Schlesneria paludicola]
MGLLAGTPFDRPPHCERCDRLESECTCPPETAKSNLVAPDRQTARLAVEKRRKGKVVTVISGLAANQNDFPALLTQLKSFCGAGGTSDGDTLEIQGDHLDRLQQKLKQIGYRVR